jgi:hypothetical protein
VQEGFIEREDFIVPVVLLVRDCHPPPGVEKDFFHLFFRPVEVFVMPVRKVPGAAFTHTRDREQLFGRRILRGKDFILPVIRDQPIDCIPDDLGHWDLGIALQEFERLFLILVDKHLKSDFGHAAPPCYTHILSAYYVYVNVYRGTYTMDCFQSVMPN